MEGQGLEFETHRGEAGSHRVISGANQHSLRLDRERKTLDWDGVTLEYQVELVNGRPIRVILGDHSFDVELIKQSGNPPSSRSSTSNSTSDPSSLSTTSSTSSPTKPKLKLELEAGQAITAPMPGTVVSIAAREGQVVESGQVLLVLEAMKMENEIKAQAVGTVRQIAVQPGDSVNGGDVLIVLE